MPLSQILTLNERVKGFSSCFFNLSAALTAAAAAARAWVNRDVDLAVPAWALVAIALLLVAHKVLYLLETSSEDTP
ncbi:MAG: hypothetical protein QOG72_1927 [Sphingomonadales bacterium]|jgi:hypothetical protein|nr:hypothetical protein [Sphingomonadales bacterium]